MFSPICFSQYFTNKQNVRSLNNILNIKLLQSENKNIFIEKLVGGRDAFGELSPEILNILAELWYNIKCCSKQDFKEFLSVQVNKEDNNILGTVSKEDVFTSCMNALTNIVPQKLFNCNKNKKIFKQCVKLIIYSMNRQYIDFEKLIKQWDVCTFPWNTMSSFTAIKIMSNILYWIFKTLLSAVIVLHFFVTTCKVDGIENKLYIFWKKHWQAFYDKKLSDMVFMKVICKYEPYCTSKKSRKMLDKGRKLDLKIIKKSIPKLHLILKRNDQYRPIVSYKNDSSNQSDKYKVKDRLHFIQLLYGTYQEKIENQYKSLYKKWLNKKCPPLYFVKTDLSNAFGSVDERQLLKIIHEKFLKFEKKDIPLYLKKKYLLSYKDLLCELAQPILFRAGSTIYEWKKGLVQGYKYSPALSELYYAHLDKTYFSELVQNIEEEVKLFIRVVDDYLFVTDSLDDAHAFLHALSNYNNVNLDKTVVNFPHPTIRCSTEISFLGYNYNTFNLQVSRGSTAYGGQVCYKIHFSPGIADFETFIKNRIGQGGIHVNCHIFNFYYNNEELVWNQIFITLCLSANKFCCILAMLCDEREMPKYLSIYKKTVTVKLCNSVIETLQRNQSKKFIFIYCINHFRYLSFKALLLCARHTPKCNILVPYVNVEVAKTNCVYGKWREHFSRISKEGQQQGEAVRDICRRSELRSIMKSFESLPKDFQCFNHKIFYNKG